MRVRPARPHRRARSLLSHHLRVLRHAGIVTVTRRGRWMDYTLAPDVLARLTDVLAPALSGAAR